jgi:hypothetical protein
LNELIQVFIHHHATLVQIREFLFLQLEGAMGHVVTPEEILELILGDFLNSGMGFAVSLPPICYGYKQLVCHKKNFLTVGTLGYL